MMLLTNKNFINF